jgi:hypothetical protein
MTDDQFLLANAYLDGELTVEERARAEADPVVMGAVGELRTLQDLVRDVEPPSAAAREDAITAAMTAFASAAAVDAPVPSRSRPSAVRYVAVAAGVLAVGLVGVAIANLGGDDAAIDESATELSAAASTVERVEGSDGDAAEDLAAAEVATADAAAESADESADESAAVPGTSTSLPDFGQVLTSPEEVGAFGAVLLTARDEGTLPPTPNHACDYPNVLAMATYVDPLEPDGSEQDLLIDVDEAERLVLGVDPDTCRTVVEGPLPGP